MVGKEIVAGRLIVAIGSILLFTARKRSAILSFGRLNEEKQDIPYPPLRLFHSPSPEDSNGSISTRALTHSLIPTIKLSHKHTFQIRPRTKRPPLTRHDPHPQLRLIIKPAPNLM